MRDIIVIGIYVTQKKMPILALKTMQSLWSVIFSRRASILQHENVDVTRHVSRNVIFRIGFFRFAESNFLSPRYRRLLLITGLSNTTKSDRFPALQIFLQSSFNEFLRYLAEQTRDRILAVILLMNVIMYECETFKARIEQICLMFLRIFINRESYCWINYCNHALRHVLRNFLCRYLHLRDRAQYNNNFNRKLWRILSVFYQ